ncbi:MAG: MBL fold metallo-hydrolase [Desulfobacca sp.]|uniref:MBL fold metallo-hydrolase n=1 Tax=Desulfobacca sp. TaxID=2067990 RepID=UPI0040499C16
MELPELSAVTVDIVVDNFIDVFEPSKPGVVERVAPGRLKKPLLAAHGLAMLVTVQRHGESRRILMDTSNSSLVFFNNLEALEIPVDNIDALFLSHGHPDHYGALQDLLQRRAAPLDIYLHPASYLPKLLITPRGRVGPWQLARETLVQLQARLHENTAPALIDGMALITGPIEASVAYETPLPGPKRLVAGQEERDTFEDEQALVMRVKDQGLVIVAACSHPGITNIVKYAQKLTGETRVAAVIGGFHLTAGGPELIHNTIKGLQELNIGLILSGHCTGFRALTQLMAAFPQTFMVSCVGTKVSLS